MYTLAVIIGLSIGSRKEGFNLNDIIIVSPIILTAIFTDIYLLTNI